MDSYHGSLHEPSHANARLVDALAQLRQSELRLTSALARLLEAQRRLAESLVRLRDGQARLLETLQERFPGAWPLPTATTDGTDQVGRLACPVSDLTGLVTDLDPDARN